MDTNKPMALRLADKYEHEGFLSDHKFAQNQWCSHAAVELRRLHAENTALQSGYDAARLEIASLQAQLEVSGVGGVEPLVCDYCGALTPDPWHSSGMLHGKMSKHIHSCAACAALAAPAQADGFGSAEHWKEKAQYWAGVAHRLRQEALRGEPVDGIIAPQAQASAPIDADVQRDAERYRWMRDMNDWYSDARIDDADGTKWQLTFYTPQSIEDQSDDNNLDYAIDAAIAAQRRLE